MSKTAEIVKDTASKAAEELSEPVTIGVEAYISEDYARAERDKLWRKVWLQVGRVEEIPERRRLHHLRHPRRLDPDRSRGGGRDPRVPQRVRAPRPPARRHAQGRSATRGVHGGQEQFACGFHGWRYDLDGECTHIRGQGGLAGRADERTPI